MPLLSLPNIIESTEESLKHEKSSTDEEELSQWKTTRNAVIHTVDISQKHSDHAQKIVRGFRNGVYRRDIDFYVGDLPYFFANHKSYQKQFLTHVILDMPSAERQLGLVAEHLQTDGKLLVFNPSITQIVECIEHITQHGIPFHLERVIELAGSFSGGREWDVRIAKIKRPKAELSPKTSTTPANSTSFWSQLSAYLSSFWNIGNKQPLPAPQERNWAVVCRPKAGERIPVGGFVGIWRRKHDDE
jgi:tRNA (adenine57-N1/adenine58-N1)-methyltransferase catalytic subunit